MNKTVAAGFIMRNVVARAVIVAAAGLWLAGCVTNDNSNSLAGSASGADAFAAASPADAAALPPPLGASAETGLLGGDPNDDLSLGKKQYRATNYGMAEKHFRRAVESHPRDAEAWLGLAASYDRLRRYELADRAYNQAIGIVGPTAEILNNQGYSYMLRGDYKRARAKLADAQRKEPGNRFVQNNIQLLEESYRKGKAIE